tara:strand:+ start:209 stop:1009 length:801 start_codon:yes stop_codon:yes gene_type:complete
MNQIVTNKVINKDKKLKYLIVIPCVNREERNAINVIDETFLSFKKSGMFESNIDFKILLFESGSYNKGYLDFLKEYQEMYPEKINIIYSDLKLNGNGNTFKMFMFLNKIPRNLVDFIIWMDDDVFVCNNFIKNADAWIKKYANFSLFSSLYVPYDSYSIKDFSDVKHAKLPGFIGTCCTVFKPEVIKYPLAQWYHKHHQLFNFNPDVRFRESIRKYFFHVTKICVSYPSLVQHMNIGSSIYKNKNKNKGHKCKNFAGEDVDPKFYE